jgi:hypothetical protein
MNPVTLNQLLQGLSYTPRQGEVETKQLRQQYAGDPQMQQRLALDDRFHQGRTMPSRALGAAIASVPYDLAKLAYFHGPKPVKEALGSLSEQVLPGEGFNDRTTSRPDIRQYLALASGARQGVGEQLREKLARWQK